MFVQRQKIMNEIDPTNSNGSATTETHQQQDNKSPLLSSLLTSSKHETIANGQQSGKGSYEHGMMPTPAIVTNPQFDDANAFMTRKTNETANELDLTTNSHRKTFSNLNDLLQRNNNNNKVSEASTAKSILENCLLKPSPLKSQRPESQLLTKMDEGEFHHHGNPSTSSVLKFSPTEDSRKVEPLKINLNREPIRTVIKLPQSHPYENKAKTNSLQPATVSPTLSSSSSLSSESSFDNCHDNHRSIQVIPKLHIRSTQDASLNHDQNELHIVPKLTITGLNSPQSTVNHEPADIVLEAIPKLTIKKDNNTSDYHLNNDTNSIPKLHIKTNHSCVPKLTIKTKPDSEAVIVESEQPAAIPKLTIKSIKPPVEEAIPKLTLKAVNNSAFEKVVPKLVVKVPKEPVEETPHVPKLNIKPIPPPEVPKPKNCVDSAPSGNHSIDGDACKPLEINTTGSAESGLDSPRIILKINKTNSEAITSEIVAEKNHKRAHSNDEEHVEDVKKPKLAAQDEEEDVILINDSDTSSNDTMVKNHTVKPPVIEIPRAEVRSLRQSKRKVAAAAAAVVPVVEEPPQSVKEDSRPPSEADPLALSMDGNSNSVDDVKTPKRGRGRPKKVVEKVVEEETSSRDPLELALEQSIEVPPGEESSEVKKTPGRGRGRGRGRLKRTVEVMKNGKPIQITLEGHDDDDSPSFSLYNRSIRGGFSTGRKQRGGKTGRGKSLRGSPFVTPERSKDGHFTSPTEQNNRKKLFNTPSLFEEDTRMSIGCDSAQQTPVRVNETQSCEESQSSLLSSASNTVEGSTKKRHKKMEVCEPEGRTEFAIDLLAEYEWPQNEPGRHHDSFMIQEQIAEYLGVKSFKRKYPDLVRRTVDMEERNYLFENGLASEKMCDLGLTAVYASEVLDIMCNDYPEKYEEYKRYQREKAFRFARMRLETAVVDRSQMQKDKAITSASEWNTRFNKDRRENRRSCMDLQNFLIQKPTPIRDYNTTPAVTHQSHYPVALVPGQFSEFYEKYTPLQLACYPINTVLVDQKKLEQYLAANPNALDSSDDSDSSDSEEENETSSESGSESSSDDEYEDPRCTVCSQTPFVNQYKQPEKFVKCSKCKNQAHPSCIEMSTRMCKRVLAYKWQCSNCKTCCKCRKVKDNKMLYCVQCDRGFHIYCLGLRNVPEGQYHCDNCQICSECGAKTPEGHFNPALTQQQRQDLAMISQWNHEFSLNPLTKIREHVASLCLPCYRKSNDKQHE